MGNFISCDPLPVVSNTGMTASAAILFVLLARPMKKVQKIFPTSSERWYCSGCFAQCPLPQIWAGKPGSQSGFLPSFVYLLHHLLG